MSNLNNSTQSILHRMQWQLPILCIASIIFVYITVTLNHKMDNMSPETGHLSSVFNKKASGLSALFEISNRSGLVCFPWEMPYRELKDKHGLLFIANPVKWPSSTELEQIFAWVAAGNQLICLDTFNDPPSRHFLSLLKIKSSFGETIENLPITSATKNKQFTYVNALLISSKTRLHKGEALLSDKYGAFFTQLNYQKGKIILGTPIDFCANYTLRDKQAFDNFQFMLNCLSTAGGSIFFDERCHGFSNIDNLFLFLLRHKPGLVLSQLLLILLIAIGSAFFRFGQTEKLINKREISNRQFIIGLANAYERVGANLACLEIIVQDFKSKLCQGLNISPQASNSEIVSAWENSSHKSAGNLNSFLTNYDLLCAQKKISSSDLKESISKCDRLSKEASSFLLQKL